MRFCPQFSCEEGNLTCGYNEDLYHYFELSVLAALLLLFINFLDHTRNMSLLFHGMHRIV